MSHPHHSFPKGPALPSPEEATSSLQRRAIVLAASERFQLLIAGIIVLNAVTLGLETYTGFSDAVLDTLKRIDIAIYCVFCVELAIRFVAFGRRPQHFFRNGWNVFDFLIIAGVWLPGLRENATLLRLLRLLRVARLLRFLPDVPLLLDGVRRTLRPAAGLVALTFLLLFLYGMVGWALFRGVDPERWGNISDAMLTLFGILTLEGWNEVLSDASEATPFAWVYFLSFILIGTFVVLNLVIGIVINSLEEAHAAVRAKESSAQARVEDKIGELRKALDDLEADLRSGEVVILQASREGAAGHDGAAAPAGDHAGPPHAGNGSGPPQVASGTEVGRAPGVTEAAADPTEDTGTRG